MSERWPAYGKFFGKPFIFPCIHSSDCALTENLFSTIDNENHDKTVLFK